LRKSKIFFPYEKSAGIDLVYALVTNYSIKAKTIVELSLNKFFNRPGLLTKDSNSATINKVYSIL